MFLTVYIPPEELNEQRWFTVEQHDLKGQKCQPGETVSAETLQRMFPDLAEAIAQQSFAGCTQYICDAQGVLVVRISPESGGGQASAHDALTRQALAQARQAGETR